VLPYFSKASLTRALYRSSSRIIVVFTIYTSRYLEIYEFYVKSISRGECLKNKIEEGEYLAIAGGLPTKLKRGEVYSALPGMGAGPHAPRPSSYGR